MFLLKIDDTVGELHDGGIRRARFQTARLLAMHAAVFAHQPHQIVVGVNVLGEFDEVPIIPARLRHGLVGVVEDRRREGITVPFQTGDFASFATDACRHVN